MPWQLLESFHLFTVLTLCCLLGYWLLLRSAPGETQARAMALPAGKVHFKASEEWREVLPHHVLPNGLEIRFDLASGRNFARLGGSQSTGSRSDGSDEASVVKLLCDAATWGKQERVEQALQSCHFRPELLSAPLAEAAGRGHLEVSQALVTARADPLGKGPKGVTALHRAVMEGHEEVAQVLLRQCHALGVENPLAVEDDLGRTCLDCAIEQDLHGVARRLKALEAATEVESEGAHVGELNLARNMW
ncbi:unnamed protein product [Cladocopium goreaui]|uniref:Uncharacterized protein n=1 Tax=Cladocopium goreaui TaxID=2562237 RepID=A0A9P1CMT1_9DINO|nr:unnamed protein product [Cladocopium goreaui]